MIANCPRCGHIATVEVIEADGPAECLLCSQCEADYARRPSGQWLLVRDFAAERRASIGADADQD